ncbi:MAG: sigma 54-interacting transcriptional regulator [Thermodesulfobacteriota bacterium]
MKSGTFRTLVVAKDAEIAQRVRRLVRQRRGEVALEPSIDHVLERMEREFFDILLITSAAFKAGEVEGMDLLEVIRQTSPATQVLFLAHPWDIQDAMAALDAGSYHYMKLPVSDKELRLMIKTALANRPVSVEETIAAKGRRAVVFEEMYGRSGRMQEVFRQIRQAAVTDVPILLVGETGTGKELAARAIHRQSDRADGPYIPVNAGAIPSELVASELFGHEKGAFTGAAERSKGKFELANNGTLFLDEITSIDQKVQVSLLRLIEQKKFHRLGGRRALSTNARLIAASNEGLFDAIEQGSFREDLFYRLDVFRITMPPLRERAEDVTLLIDEFVKRYNTDFEKNILGISPECVGVMQAYEWPGNVRELKNVIQRAILVCDGEVILREHLPSRFHKRRALQPKVAFEIGTTLDAMEREMIVRTLAASENNRKRAAEILGISRRALYNKLRKHAIK